MPPDVPLKVCQFFEKPRLGPRTERPRKRSKKSEKASAAWEPLKDTPLLDVGKRSFHHATGAGPR